MVAEAKSERLEARLVTVSFVTNGGDVLLLRHADSSDRFAGQWNGVGGHVEVGEGIREAAARELREETGVEVMDLALRGVVHNIKAKEPPQGPQDAPGETNEAPAEVMDRRRARTHIRSF